MANKEQTSENAITELDWIAIREDYISELPETTKEKMLRKINENPLVPIGVGATAGALGVGLWNFRKGNKRMSQLMMRTRIFAQGFTVIALIFGVAFTYNKKKE